MHTTYRELPKGSKPLATMFVLNPNTGAYELQGEGTEISTKPKLAAFKKHLGTFNARERQRVRVSERVRVRDSERE